MIEIDGTLNPYNTGRNIEYSFEPGEFVDAESEEYYDNNWEDIEDEILNKFNQVNESNYDKKIVDTYWLGNEMRKLHNDYLKKKNQYLQNIEADKDFNNDPSYWLDKILELNQEHSRDVMTLKEKLKDLKY